MHGLADILRAVLWPAVVAYAVWRLAPVWQRFAPAPVGVTADDVAIPDDIIGYIAEFPDSWAQDDNMRFVREKYAEYKDWNKVRRALDLAPSPQTS